MDSPDSNRESQSVRISSKRISPPLSDSLNANSHSNAQPPNQPENRAYATLANTLMDSPDSNRGSQSVRISSKHISPPLSDSPNVNIHPNAQPPNQPGNKAYVTLANTLASLQPLFVPIWHDKDAQLKVALQERNKQQQKHKQASDKNRSLHTPDGEEEEDEEADEQEDDTLPPPSIAQQPLPKMVQLNGMRRKLNKIRDIFSLLADGVEQIDTVDYDLIEYALNALGFSPTDEECEKFKADIMRRQMSALSNSGAPAQTTQTVQTGAAAQTTNNARIDLPTFYHEIKQNYIKQSEPQYVDMMRSLFKECDLREAGLITADDVRAMLTFMGEKNTLSEDEIVELVKDCDLDDDGGINQKEFFKIMKYSQLHPEWKLVYCKKDAAGGTTGGGGGGGGAAKQGKKKADENRLLNNPLKMLKTKYNY